MTCKKFENWLTSEDAKALNPPPGHLTRHLDECGTCREIHRIDSHIDHVAKESFTAQELPAGLIEKIDTAIDTRSRTQVFTPKRIFSTLAAACIIAVLFYFQFYHSAGRFENLQELSLSAVSRHLDADTTMTFDAKDMDSAVIELSKELDFNVIIPDLSPRSFTLLGGRICVVGKCKTAYIFYEFEGRTCSLFIIDYDRFDFKMADGSHFSNIVKGCRTDIWKENGQVYTLVY